MNWPWDCLLICLSAAGATIVVHLLCVQYLVVHWDSINVFLNFQLFQFLKSFPSHTIFPPIPTFFERCFLPSSVLGPCWKEIMLIRVPLICNEDSDSLHLLLWQRVRKYTGARKYGSKMQKWYKLTEIHPEIGLSGFSTMPLTDLLLALSFSVSYFFIYKVLEMIWEYECESPLTFSDMCGTITLLIVIFSFEHKTNLIWRFLK